MKDMARQQAFLALRAVDRGAFADAALDRVLQSAPLTPLDRRLVTELVYGSVRRRRTLDALIDQFAKKPAQQQPADLRLILQLGFYQLRYLSHIPSASAVDTTVELAKTNGFKGLAGVVNGVLRQYVRTSGGFKDEQRSRGEAEAKQNAADSIAPSLDPLHLPSDPIARLGVYYSYPDWIVALWVEQFGLEKATRLCEWFNQPPHIDLRLNPLRTSIEQVEAAMQSAGVLVQRVPALPQALRLPQGVGAIQKLPGFAAGWWSVQDSSAQLVGHLLDPQPGEVVVDACAAPGGKTTHLAELMQDQGTVWGCDRAPARLKKLQENAARLQLRSIQICAADSRQLSQFQGRADRLLLDAPCSGLGTLHRHADARWRQTPATVQELAQLQTELLRHTATWVKPGGVLVYATCTLHPAENEAIVAQFLADSPDWSIDPPAPGSAIAQFAAPEGWLKVLPDQQDMDGFFMVRLRTSPNRAEQAD